MLSRMRSLTAVAVLLALVITGTGIAMLMPGAVMAAVTINRDRVKNVIYPTLGFPAIVRCGDMMTIEFDPRNQDWSAPMPQVTEFEVSAVTTNSKYPVTEYLPVDSFRMDYSKAWPEYSQFREPRARIYLVTVAVTEDVPLHLYDLTVRAHLGDGSWMTDSQPHAMQTVESFKDDFKISQLTDIHVWGPEVAYPGSYTGERNYRHSDYRAEDGYGATYYHKTIKQVNRQKPDFITFTGDYDFSQKWIYKQDYAEFAQYKNSPWNGKYYEPYFEMDWFYEETLKLDVPVFMTLGNHDSYARYDLFNINLEEDYKTSWRNLFGPQYYSFDYGSDYHFTAVDSCDWSSRDRNLHWLIPNVITMPNKWQGQVGSGGDAFKAGWSQEREDAIDENKFQDQLLWLKQDLTDHPTSKMRTVLMHHDPWRQDGSGKMFDDASAFGVYFGGKGTGRLAVIKLLREHNVALVLSGHEHDDSYGTIPWTAGGGEVKFVNTTSTMLQDGDFLDPKFDKMTVFPGYKNIRIVDGDVESFSYKLANGIQYSWPVYAGTNVGGETNFANLTTPAVESQWVPSDPGDSETVLCRITNHLTGETMPGGAWTGDLQDVGMQFDMPHLDGGYYYEVTNGTFGDVWDNSDTDPDHRMYQVFADVSHAPDDATPTVKDVTVQESASPDTTPPACVTGLRINGGAATTTTAEVTLTNDATDAESGMLDMKIWNDDGDQGSAEWQRWEPSTSWVLRKLGGTRTVNVQFRDRAMPGNVSGVYSANIDLIGDPPSITGLDPWSAHVGETVEITGTDFGTQSPSDKVRFNGLAAEVQSWTDTSITCTVPQGAYNGVVTVTNDAGSVSADFQVLPDIAWITPSYGWNDMTVHVTNIEGNGFYAQDDHPHVWLRDSAHSIAATNVEVISPQSISCDFDLDGEPVGLYTVVVQNADDATAELTGGFAVDYPPPELTSITPDNGLNNGVINITDLAGDHFRAGMEVFLTDEITEIEATNVQVVSPAKTTCDFDLTGAAPGTWNVYVENDDGEGALLPEAFTVENPAPVVTGITPGWGYINGTVNITDLAGTGFLAGATVKLAGAGQPDIAASDVVVESASKITCRFDLAGAEGGTRDVVVTNSDGKSGTLAGGFEARWSTTHISSVAPGSGKPGDLVTIKGSNFGATRGGSAVKFGDVPADDFVSWSDSLIKVRVPVGGAGNLPVVVTAATGPSNASEFGVVQPAWYLPEGSTAWGFETYVSVANPNARRAVTIEVTYMTESGAIDGGTYSLKPDSQLTLNPAEVVGEHDFSTRVVCREGLDIAADRTMSWNGGIEGHTSLGVPGAAKTWYLAEGCSAFGFETWLLIQNPGASEARCTLTYMVEGKGPMPVQKTVPPRSRATFNMKEDIGEENASVQVTSDVPVVPERSMYRNGRREGHDSVGTAAPATDFYLAEGSTAWGFTTWVVVQNPNALPASVTLTNMTPNGPVPAGPFAVAPGARVSICLNDHVPDTDVSVRVHGDRPIVAERAMYWDNGTGEACHDSIGVAGAHVEFCLPDGQTSGGRETWTTVQNPNDSGVEIEITYMTDDSGGNVIVEGSLPARSRATYDMSKAIGAGRAAIKVRSKDPAKPIIVERSMYWDNRGAGTESIGAYSD